MAKRFVSTEIWQEDWFLEMPNEYKLFWYYMLSNCDHAGVYKVNLRSFCGLLEVNVSPIIALDHFNNGKNRIRVISETLWLIEDFFVYQYGTTFNRNNRVHESIESVYQKQKIELSSIRGLLDLKDRVKDKDKDKDIKKGGKGENKIMAERIDGEFAYFGDGTKQPLGASQSLRFKNDDLKSSDITKGYIV